jgi:hypothetical protein
LCLAIGVLGVEVGADLRVEDGGLAHDLLPVLCLQPSVIVDQFDAMPSGHCGTAGGARWFDEGMTVGRNVHRSLRA